ncbi:MAG: DeoR family transcriptional regulator, partial [Pseudobutyrivibrio sp.]|nr:DeoR family transcriptional regulator [Pseudobutyrivibrio sp.]
MGGIALGANTRLKHITETVQSNNRVSVTELSKKCNVTEETIRKDLS